MSSKDKRAIADILRCCGFIPVINEEQEAALESEMLEVVAYIGGDEE